jgi:hypothetical protein
MILLVFDNRAKILDNLQLKAGIARIFSHEFQCLSRDDLEIQHTFFVSFVSSVVSFVNPSIVPSRGSRRTLRKTQRTQKKFSLCQNSSCTELQELARKKILAKLCVFFAFLAVNKLRLCTFAREKFSQRRKVR